MTSPTHDRRHDAPALQPSSPQAEAALKEMGNLLRKITDVFEFAARAPTPIRSLYTPYAGEIARDLFSKHNTIFLAEVHDDVNYKFLADNPDIFKQAAQRGGQYLFAELPVLYSPLFKSYFDGKLTESAFEQKMIDHTPGQKFTSGDSIESYAKQIVATCKTARENNIRIVPSDFRDIGEESKMTSDVYGIPDINDQHDSVHALTLLSLKEFQATQKIDHPVTVEDHKYFLSLHNNRINNLSPNQRELFEKDSAARIAEIGKDNTGSKIEYQDKMQFNYYSRLVAPGEPSLFFGGANHFQGANGIDNLIQQNGYGSVGGVLMLSEHGALFDKLINDFNKAAQNPDLPQYAQKTISRIIEEVKNADIVEYTIHTETGDAFDRNGKILAPVPMNQKPDQITPEKEKPAPVAVPQV